MLLLGNIQEFMRYNNHTMLSFPKYINVFHKVYLGPAMILAVIRGFNLRSVYVLLGVEEVLMGQIFLQVGVLWHASHCVIPLKPHIH